MQLDRDGAQHLPKALTPTDTAAFRDLLGTSVSAGTRLAPPRDGEVDHPKGGGGGPPLAQFLTSANEIARHLLGPLARPVRAVFFDKTPERNWSLGWHQDRTIAVKHRIDTPGFADWTHKSGIHHVVPPFENPRANANPAPPPRRHRRGQRPAPHRPRLPPPRPHPRTRNPRRRSTLRYLNLRGRSRRHLGLFHRSSTRPCAPAPPPAAESSSSSMPRRIFRRAWPGSASEQPAGAAAHEAIASRP